MSRQIRVLCGVPPEHCNGSRLITYQKLDTDRAHMGHEEAFKCMVRYLTKVLGYQQIGSREFRPPDGGYTQVLTKRSRYGARLVYGKEHSRFMPEKRDAGNRGVIVG